MKILKIISFVFLLSFIFSCINDNEVNKKDNIIVCNDNQYCNLLFVLDKTNDFTKKNFSDISKVSFYKEVNVEVLLLKKEVHSFSDTSNKFIAFYI